MKVAVRTHEDSDGPLSCARPDRLAAPGGAAVAAVVVDASTASHEMPSKLHIALVKLHSLDLKIRVRDEKINIGYDSDLEIRVRDEKSVLDATMIPKKSNS